MLYRDLKPENILIARDGHIKVVDFGFAKQIEAAKPFILGAPQRGAPPCDHPACLAATMKQSLASSFSFFAESFAAPTETPHKGPLISSAAASAAATAAASAAAPAAAAPAVASAAPAAAAAAVATAAADALKGNMQGGGPFDQGAPLTPLFKGSAAEIEEINSPVEVLKENLKEIGETEEETGSEGGNACTYRDELLLLLLEEDAAACSAAVCAAAACVAFAVAYGDAAAVAGSD